MADGERPAGHLVKRIKGVVLTENATERVLLGLGSTALALLIGLVVVAVSGFSPLLFLNELVVGAFGSERGIALTLRESTMFILAGVAVAVAFRAGIFNIGVQGQFIFGGLTTTLTILWLVPYLPATPGGGILLMLIGTTAGVLVGGAYAALPGALKAFAGANEIITTIMLNFIALGIALYLLAGPFRGPDRQEPRTESLPEYVGFPNLVFDVSTFSVVGLLVALLTVLGAYWLLTQTRWGYDMVTSGVQQPAALYGGVSASRTIVGTMTLSGMVAGLTGSVFTIMILGGYVDPHGIHTYGFDAIAVSLLAANNPLGVVPAGVLFGVLARGGSVIGITTDIPAELIDGVIGLVILFVAAPELFRMRAFRRRFGEGDT